MADVTATPLRDNVLVQRVKVDSSEGGILLPDGAAAYKIKVIATGPDVKCGVKPGQYVQLNPRGQGVLVELDECLLIVPEDALMATLSFKYTPKLVAV